MFNLFEDVTGPTRRDCKRTSSTSSAFPPTRAAESCHGACGNDVAGNLFVSFLPDMVSYVNINIVQYKNCVYLCEKI